MLVEGREQRLERRLGRGGRGLLQRAEVRSGVRRGRAVARVGRAAAQGGGGRGGEAPQAGGGVDEGLVVEEECTLVDEGLDDCLVGACGRQGVHGGEVGPHEGWPETDGQVLAGHQVHPTQLAHPVGQCRPVTHQWPVEDGRLIKESFFAVVVVFGKYSICFCQIRFFGT